MRRAEILEAAEKASQRPIPHYVLEHAIRRGFVDKPPMHAGWAQFEEKHLRQFMDYLANHSRGPRNRKLKGGIR
jgi:hypothetical protein